MPKRPKPKTEPHSEATTFSQISQIPPDLLQEIFLRRERQEAVDAAITALLRTQERNLRKLRDMTTLLFYLTDSDMIRSSGVGIAHRSEVSALQYLTEDSLYMLAQYLCCLIHDRPSFKNMIVSGNHPYLTAWWAENKPSNQEIEHTQSRWSHYSKALEKARKLLDVDECKVLGLF